MTLSFRQLTPHFAAEVSPVDLRRVTTPPLSPRFAAGWTATRCWSSATSPSPTRSSSTSPSASTASSTPSWAAARSQKNRLGNEALGDISNLDENGEILRRRPAPHVRRSATASGTPTRPSRTRRGATRCSRPGGPAGGRRHRVRGHARRLRRPARGDEGAARRPAASTTPSPTRGRRSASSSPRGGGPLKGAIHPAGPHLPALGAPVALRRLPRLADHRLAGAGRPPAAARPDEHATQPQFVYRHAWRVGDLVIWDNRATMHRGAPFDDTKYRRELRRVTTLDVEAPVPATV